MESAIGQLTSGATAYPTIRPGNVLGGELSEEDASAIQGSPAGLRYWDDYLLQGVAPGQQVRLTLESSAFDAYLEVVLLDDPDDVRESNDNGSGGGSNAQLTHTIGSGRAANVLVRVRSNGASGVVGAYRLGVELPAVAPVISERPSNTFTCGPAPAPAPMQARAFKCSMAERSRPAIRRNSRASTPSTPALSAGFRSPQAM